MVTQGELGGSGGKESDGRVQKKSGIREIFVGVTRVRFFFGVNRVWTKTCAKEHKKPTPPPLHMEALTKARDTKYDWVD